jgi:hypothetical protein
MPPDGSLRSFVESPVLPGHYEFMWLPPFDAEGVAEPNDVGLYAYSEHQLMDLLSAAGWVVLP